YGVPERNAYTLDISFDRAWLNGNAPRGQALGESFQLTAGRGMGNKGLISHSRDKLIASRGEFGGDAVRGGVCHDMYSFCGAIANCLQRKQKRVLVHT